MPTISPMYTGGDCQWGDQCMLSPIPATVVSAHPTAVSMTVHTYVCPLKI